MPTEYIIANVPAKKELNTIPLFGRSEKYQIMAAKLIEFATKYKMSNKNIKPVLYVVIPKLIPKVIINEYHPTCLSRG